MQNRWKKKEARRFLHHYRAAGEDLALRTYSARLIGQESNLVLHGGGNTSVKTSVRTLTGETVSVLCVKGSGWDLATIEPPGHPAVRLTPLLELRKLPKLSDEDMMNFFRCQMLDSNGPNPSVETLLHAFIPHKFIDHTHADAVLALADQPDGVKRLMEWSEGQMGVVPYIMPGFTLAKSAASIYEENPRVEGLLLLKHGIFTFGDSAEESYDRMIKWVTKAEKTVRTARVYSFVPARSPSKIELEKSRVANIVRGVCAIGKGGVVRQRSSPPILRFVNSRQARTLSQIGPATPDHVIRTKPVPLLLPPDCLRTETTFRSALQSGLEKFKKTYRTYVAEGAKRRAKIIPLDPLPRIILIPKFGLFSIAADAKAADVALDIYEHTLSIIEGASRIGRYEVLSRNDLFDMEYWSLEQAKLGQAQQKPFARKVVWISGAASGIGRATAKAFLKEGAHVFITDVDGTKLNQAAASLNGKERVRAELCDVTQPAKVQRSFDNCSTVFGGVDIVVSNAGFAPTAPMKSLDNRLLRQSFELNFYAHQNVAKAATAVFERQQLGGCLLFNASKSAFNPGPEFGPYTLPKTAVIGLMKQYAVELGGVGVRSNAVNADRVRTNLYKGGLLEERAKARGISVGSYLKGNLLHEEVFADDVAQAFLFFARAEKTTGATLPVDGGNAAAFPR